MPASILGSLAVNVIAKSQGFSKAMKKSRESLKGVGAQAAKLKTTLAGLHSAFIGIAAVGGAGAFIKSQLTQIDALAKTADKLGINIQALGALQIGAELSGVSIENMNTGLQRMTRRVSEAAIGTGAAKNALAELGINAQTLSRQAPDQQFIAISKALGAVATQGDKVRLAMQIFDTEGVGLVNFTNATEVIKEFKDSIPTSEQADNVEELNDAFAKLKVTLGAALRPLIIDATPDALKFVESLAQLIKDIKPVFSLFSKGLEFNRTNRRVLTEQLASISQGGRFIEEPFRTKRLDEQLREANAQPRNQRARVGVGPARTPDLVMQPAAMGG
jgi:hypothetical protein